MWGVFDPIPDTTEANLDLSLNPKKKSIKFMNYCSDMASGIYMEVISLETLLSDSIRDLLSVLIFSNFGKWEGKPLICEADIRLSAMNVLSCTGAKLLSWTMCFKAITRDVYLTNCISEL